MPLVINSMAKSTKSWMKFAWNAISLEENSTMNLMQMFQFSSND